MKKIILTTFLSLGLMLGLTSCFGEDQTPKYKESKIEVENTYSILKVYPETVSYTHLTLPTTPYV